MPKESYQYIAYINGKEIGTYTVEIDYTIPIENQEIIKKMYKKLNRKNIDPRDLDKSDAVSDLVTLYEEDGLWIYIYGRDLEAGFKIESCKLDNTSCRYLKKFTKKIQIIQNILDSL